VLDPHPPRSATRTPAALERCRRLDFDPRAEAERPVAELRAAAVMIEAAGATGMPGGALVTRVGADPREVGALIESMEVHGIAVRAGTVLVSAAVFERLKRAILDALTAHHAANPLSDGIPREEARERLFRRGHLSVFERAVDDLAAAGTIVARDRLALASHRLELSPEEERARAAIEQVLQESGLTPPEPLALASRAAVSAPVADRVLKLLLRRKTVVKLDALVFHETVLKRLKSDVTALKQREGGTARMDVGTFKERFGVSRKFAIPLLEYLDRERVTRRIGDARIIL
jgi:selenocysteine-specific elongation factor